LSFVQAEPKSGALITALQALDENRSVMAVPGDVGDPRSRGPHDLLRQGAALVDGAAAILETLGWAAGPPAAATEAPAIAPDDPAAARSGASAAGSGSAAATPRSQRATALLQALGRGLDPDALHERLGWSVAEMQQVLCELEIAGLIERGAGGRVWVPRIGC
jgi:DNA processing protein